MQSTFCVCLLIVAVVHAELHNVGNSIKTEKRALTGSNPALQKRAPVLPTVSSSVNAGVEYADTKQQLADKSPSQRIYATPVPQIAKFSDLLAGQAPSYQAAIASQLYAPISVYQPHSGTPTTYEVSAPVPSQLAYSEHRLGYQQPSSLQYTPQNYDPKIPRQPEYPAQEILAQPQQIYNQQSIQQTYQQIPQDNYQLQAQQLAYSQAQPLHYSSQQLKQFEGQQALPKAIYSDNQQNALATQYNLAPQTQYHLEGQQQYQQAYLQQLNQNVQYIQPEITFARQQETQQKATINDLPEQNRVYDKQQFVTQNYPTQPQGPVSFASFSQNQPQAIIHHPYQQQNIQQVQQYSPEHQAAVLSRGNAAHERGLSYFRQGPQLQIQPQVQQSQVQSQVYQQAQPQAQYSIKPSSGSKAQSVTAAPAFPPVQYFGKYAQSLFGKAQQ